ncbi:hypothetical protein E2320_008281 [Naja naja]|nr:hypothetical protein E2320_008281 [Naja naja]
MANTPPGSGQSQLPSQHHCLNHNQEWGRAAPHELLILSRDWSQGKMWQDLNKQQPSNRIVGQPPAKPTATEAQLWPFPHGSKEAGILWAYLDCYGLTYFDNVVCVNAIMENLEGKVVEWVMGLHNKGGPELGSSESSLETSCRSGKQSPAFVLSDEGTIPWLNTFANSKCWQES